MLLGLFGVHGGISPNVSTFVAEFIAAVTVSLVMLSTLPEFSMIVLRCQSAIHDRTVLLFSSSGWFSFCPPLAMSALMFLSTGHVLVLAVGGGISALKYICLSNAPSSLMSARPKVPWLTENASLLLSC